MKVQKYDFNGIIFCLIISFRVFIYLVSIHSNLMKNCTINNIANKCIVFHKILAWRNLVVSVTTFRKKYSSLSESNQPSFVIRANKVTRAWITKFGNFGLVAK